VKFLNPDWGIIARMNKQKAQFIPFHAINEFMLPDYRQKLLLEIFNYSDKLSEQRRAAINRLVKKLVKVAGFRNSIVAPPTLKARSSVSSFERSPEFVANILAAWYELHPELAQKVYDLLISRGWEMLPMDTDRSVLPGFLTRWPKNDPFDVLDDAFVEAYPGDESHEYDINLMIVWLSGRLPVDMVDLSEEPVEQVD
jgi:hypothetical protein